MGIPEPRPHLVRASVVARMERYLAPLSLDTVERMCKQKVFRTAVKLGMGPRAHWWISSAEILAWKTKRNASMLDQ